MTAVCDEHVPSSALYSREKSGHASTPLSPTLLSRTSAGSARRSSSDTRPNHGPCRQVCVTESVRFSVRLSAAIDGMKSLVKNTVVAPEKCTLSQGGRASTMVMFAPINSGFATGPQFKATLRERPPHTLTSSTVSSGPGEFSNPLGQLAQLVPPCSC